MHLRGVSPQEGWLMDRGKIFVRGKKFVTWTLPFIQSDKKDLFLNIQKRLLCLEGKWKQKKSLWKTRVAKSRLNHFIFIFYSTS